MTSQDSRGGGLFEYGTPQEPEGSDVIQAVMAQELKNHNQKKKKKRPQL